MSNDLIARLREHARLEDADALTEDADFVAYMRLNSTVAAREREAADEIERLTAERDALRQDALRYRWLRMMEVRVYQDREPYNCIMAASELALDGAIDRAFAAKGKR